MKKSFSDDTLSNIHIKLDKQGLEGVSEKELLVLIDDKLEDSTQRVCAQIEDSTAPILTAVQGVRLEVKEMRSEMQEMHVEICTELQGIRADMQGMRVDMQSMHTDMQGIRTDIQSMHADIQGMRTDMREMHFEIKEMHLSLRNLNFWVKVSAVGTWAVFASLIAGLVFRACGM